MTARTPNPQAPWVQAQDGAVIKVARVDYIPAELSGNRNAVYVFAQQNGAPAYGQPFDMVLPGSVDHFAVSPVLVTDMQGGGFDPGKGQRGPFKFQLGDAYVDGIGLPLNRHVTYVITFDLGGNVPIPPPPTGKQWTVARQDASNIWLVLE